MASTKNIFITALLLLGAILFFGLSGADLAIQSFFYNSQTHTWLVDSNNAILKFVFYDGIKRLLIIIGVVVLVGLMIGWKRSSLQPYRRGLIILLASSIVVPLVVGSLKAVTNMPCPKNVSTFGGTYPHTCVWERYGNNECPKEKQKCWPAGHASGGFALMALVFLFQTRRAKIVAMGSALLIGWSMGTYKMLIGDHFFSHSVITMILAWLLIVLIVRGVDKIFQETLNLGTVQ